MSEKDISKKEVNKSGKKKIDSGLIIISTFLLLAITALLVVFIKAKGVKNMPLSSNENYQYYYAMIVDDRNSDFYRMVYEGALEAAKENGIYVELFGDNLSQNYSISELMELAIASRVDGIILTADDSDEINAIIKEAVNEGIQVVTLFSDCTNSKRCSFVGVGSYNLGRTYGGKVIELAAKRLENAPGETVKVDILIDNDSADSGQVIMISGIQDTIAISEYGENIVINAVPVDASNSFSVESSIRNILINADNELPDIIICPNEVDTTSMYQAVVDYNKVGQVDILGYFDSDIILKAVDRDIINATVTIDTRQMGAFCIEALNEYKEHGYTSQYFTADITLIDKNNIKKYMEGDLSDEN